MIEKSDGDFTEPVIATWMIVIAVLAFAVGLFTAPIINPQKQTTTDTIWDNIVKTGKIRVGTDPSWPPYEYLNDSNIIGFEVDLANAVAAKLNLTCDWKSRGFDTIITSVQSRDLDMGVSGFSVTADRLQQVTFTMPHSITHGQVIMLQSKRDQLGITTITSLQNLAALHLTVGTESGTTEQEELIKAGVTNHAFNDYGAAITDMVSASPTVDCVYAETPITTSWIATIYQTQGKSIVVIYDTPYYPCAFVVNKDAHTFVDKINGAMADIIAAGQLDALRAKWNA
jgi:ABC-type amino acid transport substrate-binding protein